MLDPQSAVHAGDVTSPAQLSRRLIADAVEQMKLAMYPREEPQSVFVARQCRRLVKGWRCGLLAYAGSQCAGKIVSGGGEERIQIHLIPLPCERDHRWRSNSTPAANSSCSGKILRGDRRRAGGPCAAPAFPAGREAKDARAQCSETAPPASARFLSGQGRPDGRRAPPCGWGCHRLQPHPRIRSRCAQSKALYVER